MMQVTISTFEELHQAVHAFSPSTAIFRGVTATTHTLRPSLGRLTFHRKGRKLEQEEKLIFEKFQQCAVPFLQFTPSDLWDWLCWHSTMACRRESWDWTHNPLVAAYFAVQDDNHVLEIA